MKQLVRSFSELLTMMSPSGTRKGSIETTYQYNWPFGLNTIAEVQEHAEAHHLRLEWRSETGWVRRRGRFKVYGKEPGLYWFVTELVMSDDWIEMKA